MECPSCGHDQETGNFCARCGTRLDGDCPSCGAVLVPGARYCTQCGEEVGGPGTAGRGSGHRERLPWYIAAALAVVILVLLLPREAERAGPSTMTSPSGVAPSAGGGDAGAGGPGAGLGGAAGPGPLSADMRTNADRLFNRVMAAAQQGQKAEVEQFMPMAVQAYNMVEGLDADGVYHLGLLHLTAGQYDDAREAANRTLQSSPDHILALGVSAEAAAAAGDSAGAAELYRRLLDAYPEEAARPLPEYQEHQQMLPVYRRAARQYLEAAGGES